MTNLGEQCKIVFNNIWCSCNRLNILTLAWRTPRQHFYLAAVSHVDHAHEHTFLDLQICIIQVRGVVGPVFRQDNGGRGRGGGRWGRRGRRIVRGGCRYQMQICLGLETCNAEWSKWLTVPLGAEQHDKFFKRFLLRRTHHKLRFLMPKVSCFIFCLWCNTDFHRYAKHAIQVQPFQT